MYRRHFLFALGLASVPSQAQAKDYKLELSDVVSYLADYDLLHRNTLIVDGQASFGAVDYFNREIYIASGPDFVYRRRAVIHEFLHLKYREKGEPRTEEQINVQTQRIYRQLYGE